MDAARIQAAAEAFIEYRMGKIDPKTDPEGWVARVIFLKPAMIPQGVPDRTVRAGRKRAEMLREEFRTLVTHPSSMPDSHPSLTPTKATQLRQQIRDLIDRPEGPAVRIRVPIYLEVDVEAQSLPDHRQVQKEAARLLNQVAPELLREYVKSGQFPELAKVTTTDPTFLFRPAPRQQLNPDVRVEPKLARAIREAMRMRFNVQDAYIQLLHLDDGGIHAYIKNYHRDGTHQAFAVQREEDDFVFVQV